MAKEFVSDRIMAPDKLRPLLTASKKIPVQAAIGLTSDGDGLLLLDRKARPKKVQALLRAGAVKAKIQLNASSLRFGRAEVDPEYDGSMIRFFINKDPPGVMRAKLVEVVKRMSFSKVEFNVDTALEESTEDDDAAQPQTADPAALTLELAALIKRVSVAAGSDAGLRERLVKLAGDASAALKGGNVDDAAGLIVSLREGVEAAPPPPSADAGLLRKELAALIGRIPEAVAQDASRKPQLATLAADANAALKAADLDGAGRGIAALRAALGSGQARGPIKTMPVWQSARDTTNIQLGKLQDAMRARGLPLLAQIADKGLNGITETRMVRMQVVLTEFDGAQGDARAKAAAKVRAVVTDMRGFLQSNPVIPLLEGNPLKIPVAIRSEFAAALDAIETSLAA